MKKILISGLLVFFSLISLISPAIADGGAAANTAGSNWIYMEGNEISPSTINGPARNYPAFIMGESTDNSRCIANGLLFEEGFARDVGTWNEDLGLEFEAGGWSGDVELCADTGEGDNVVTGGPSKSDNYRGGDHGGEWTDPDTNALTQYFQDRSFPSDEWERWWIEDTPDAHPSTWDGAIGEHGMSGFAVEDDCGPQPCDDIGTGEGSGSPPYALNPDDAFTEGAGDDDHPERGHAEITGEDPDGGLDNLHNRVQAGNLGSDTYTGVGAGNTQDEENAPDLSWNENSHIDPEDDEWALTPSLAYAIDYDGTPYATGRCYGASREQGVDKTKDQAVYANSYAYSSDVYTGGRSSGLADGIWVNPDDLDNSVLSGGFSCDLTGKDWGYGYADTGMSEVNCEQPSEDGCTIQGDPSSPGQEGVMDSVPHAIEGEMIFDYEDDPGNFDQDNLQQYPDACGDDQNEYLIREHAASYGGENNPEFDGRNDYYGCADRPTDCVFQGEVYSQGELIDIQDEEAGENGVDSYDEEICVDLDPTIPGGEWVDPDNESARDILIGDGTPDDPEYYVRDEIDVEVSDPGKVVWHDGDEDVAARKARMSPYNPIDYETGYALEDDCDPELDACDDSGFDEELIQGEFVYNPFEAGMREDDGNVFDGYSMRTLVAWGPDDTFSGDNGATTEQDQENVDGDTEGVEEVEFDSSDDFPTSDLNDSTIDMREDNWAIARTENPVGPTGRVWSAGRCYGMSPLDAGSEQGDYRITKDDKVMGNSLAATTPTSFGEQKGVWINPDSHVNTTLEGGLSCDLNGNDWGIGFNNGSGKYITDNDDELRYDPEDLHSVTGNVTFDINSDPNGIGEERNLQQYPDACGDDQNEYLIREHMDSRDDTEQEPNLERDNIYVCADRISDCAFHGEVYSEGQVVDVQTHGREERGVDSVDEEVCVDVDKSVPGGEWIDVDNESINELLKGSDYTEDDPDTYNGLVRDNASYDGDGVKWFTDDYDPAAEGELSPYHELNYSDGYALEDDVGPGVERSSDEGLTEQRFTPDAVYSYFEDGRPEDDRLNSTVEDGSQKEIIEGDYFNGISRRMTVGFANGTIYTEHGASNNQDTEGVSDIDFDSTENGFPTEKLNDSTINPDEDTWAITNSTRKLVGPTGSVYNPGKCYGPNVMDQEDLQISKNEKVVGNSFAMAVEAPGYGYKADEVDENFEWGTWVNPDSTPLSATQGNMSCDLNATDWGFGYNFAGEAEIELISTRMQDDAATATFYNWKTGETHTFTNRTDSGPESIRGQEYSLHRIDDLDSEEEASAVLKEGEHYPGDSELTGFDCDAYSTGDDEEKVCEQGGEFIQDDPEETIDLEVVRGEAREYGYDEDDPHVVMGEVTFDINSDPNGFGEDENLEQYPDACGDDPNEYLIREHRDSVDNTEQDPNLERDDTYVCADRVSDCAFHGEVYSEGQVVDIQRYGNEEQGQDSIDEEVCVDADPDIPGGEWYDVDNESINELLKGSEYTEDDPDTYNGVVRDNASYDGDGVKWFTDDYEHAREVEISPFNPLNYSDGYALEDDVGPGVNYSADEGSDEEQFTPEAVYTFFEDGHREDDRVPDPDDDTRPDPDSDYFEGISVRMWTGYANGTASAEHGATNSQDKENVPGDLDFTVTKWGETVSLNDSTIDPKEDTWAIANRTDAVIGPTGRVYMEGKCYGRHVLDQEDLQLSKNETAVGNSYAMSVDVEGDGTSDNKGVWVNPDSTPESVRSGALSCELNATDWGIGYDLGSEEELEIIRGDGEEPGDVREQGYDRDDPHAVLGEDIVFENKASWKEDDDSGDAGVIDERYDNTEPESRYEENREFTYEAMEFDGHSDTIRDIDTDSEGFIYTASWDGNIRKISSDGDEIWKYEGYGTPQGVAVDSDGNVYASGGTSVTKLDSDGNKIWKNSLSDWPMRLDVGSDRNVYTAQNNGIDGFVQKTNSDGTGSWKFNNHNRQTWDVAVDSEGYIYSASSDNTVRKISPSGNEVWKFSNHGDDVNAVDVGSDGYIYSASEDNTVRKISPSGNQIWKFNGKEENEFSDVAIDTEGYVYADDIGHSDPTSSVVMISPKGVKEDESLSYSNSDSEIDAIATSEVSGDKFAVFNTYHTILSVAIDNRTEADFPNADYSINSSEPFSGDTIEFDASESYDDGGTIQHYRWDLDGDGSFEETGITTSETFSTAGEYDIDLEIESEDGAKAWANKTIKIAEEEGGDFNPDIPPQYGEACGDDRNEYLIREHNTTDPEGYMDEHNPTLQRDNIYVCATDVSACALNGTVYQEGELADVQANDPEGANEEQGVDSVDEEVCVDVDPEVPGGEWMDVDNESVNEMLKGDHTEDDVESYESPFVRERSEYDGDGVVWFTDEFDPAREAEESPYNPLNYSDGYALEDDCASNIEYCSDEGPDEQHFTPDAVYSYFEEGRPEDDANVFEGRSVQMYVGYANGTASSEYGATNDQDEENTDGVMFDSSEFGWPTSSLNDSTIDPLEDTWALSAELEDPVGPTGKVWPEGKCYGSNPWESDAEWVTKDEKVVANSFAMGVDVNGYPPENEHYDTSELEDQEKGVWVNPDSTVESALTGVTSCDLNSTDWGFGYNTGEGDELEVVQGDARAQGFDPEQPHVVAGDITFDINSDPLGEGEDENLQQYPDACGDDQNEYLIREHTTDPEMTEHGPTLERDDIYVCADRPTDCAYNGEVYSMGQARDISGVDSDDPAEELGSDSYDAEVCVDSDPDVPGGEWVDPDNHTINELIIGDGTPEQPDTYEGFPTTQWRGGDVRWFNTSWGEDLEYPVLEAYQSPYNDVDWRAGYAFEDDVGDEVEWADDSGAEETRKKGEAVYTHFQAGEKADDGNVGDGYVLRMYVGGSAEHGASNPQEDQNVFENLPSLNDSTIDENEDTWAIGSKPYYAVGPTGEVYPNGSCYGRNNPETKAGTVVANSYALAHDVDGDGQKEGDWVDPDNYEEAILQGQDTCSLGELRDWGLGFNNESRDELRILEGDAREQGYMDYDGWEFHLVSGPITFDSEENAGTMDQDNQPQYPNACGDDQNEHLIREHTSLGTDGESNMSDEHDPQLERDNIYVCTDRVSDCAYNGSVYSEGQTVDVSSEDKEHGENSSDWEVCIDTDPRIPGGEWHDVDNTSWRDYLVGEDDPDWDYEEDNISSYKRLVEPELGTRWFTDDDEPAAEVERTPFNPLNYSDGYALEDDVDPEIELTADIGKEEQYKPGEAVYSPFEHGVEEDDGELFEGVAVRRWVGYANGTGWSDYGATNNQSEENTPDDLNFTREKWGTSVELNDSTIDENEDNWALGVNRSRAVGPTGKIYDPWKCYGNQPDPTDDDAWIAKNDTVMANSMPMPVDVTGDGHDEGVWVNPDSTEESVTRGEFSCDLNATDWGVGYNTGDGEALDPHHEDNRHRETGYDGENPHIVSGDIAFDVESDPGEQEQRDLPQYPDHCGDDRNEYLIREHGTDTGNEFQPNLSRDNIYVCADRVSDCAYNGEVYSEGQTVDISDAAAPGENPERGDDIADEEICLDLDPDIPGGEFYDKDNNWTIQTKIEEISETPDETWDRIEYFQDEDFGDNPGTDWKNRTHKLEDNETAYFNNSGFYEAEYEQYSPSGYATEDDCGPLMQETGTGPCGDVGPGIQNSSWFNAGNFSFIPNNPDMQEGAPQDNYDEYYGFEGYHNRIDDDSDQLEPGAATQRNWNLSDVYGADYRIYDTLDSTPGPDEWALTEYLNYSVDNRGNAYPPATEDRSGCFYRSDVPVRTDIDDPGVNKTDKIFGNSLAVAEDYDGDGTVEGVWKDPDDTDVKYANFTCDITGPDKGYGYDTGDDDGDFIYKNDDPETHVVEGDIAFSSIEGKKGAFEQEPPVCGDDHKEYLLEELGEVQNSLSETGRWGCGTDRNDCVSRSGGEYALYREGDTANTEEAAESFGRSKDDAEVCMQRSQDTYGVWYDQDYSQDLCQVNNLYGRQGVRWIDPDYIDEYPHAVSEGINDDLNPYLHERNSDFNESTQGDVEKYQDEGPEGTSPVPTGKYVNRSVDQYYSNYSDWEPTEEYLNLSATKGFCGGDDEGENVVVQQASTDLIETNFSVMGIADNPDDCVLDGSNIEAVDHERRQLYSPGDEEQLDFGDSQRTISCFSGQWFSNWPVTFIDRNISVEEGSTAEINFEVINVRNTRTTYEVEMNPDDELESFAEFTDEESSSFTTTLPAESTETHSIQVYGESTDIGPANISISAESQSGDIRGSDEATINVVGEGEGSEGESAQSVSEVPGIGLVQLIMLMILSTLIYYRRLE